MCGVYVYKYTVHQEVSTRVGAIVDQKSTETSWNNA